jgi:hypothetical protein
MKNLKNKLFTGLLIGAFTLLGSTDAYGQIGFPDNVDDEAPAAPIDGLIGVGLIAGAYLGLRRKLNAEK